MALEVPNKFFTAVARGARVAKANLTSSCLPTTSVFRLKAKAFKSIKLLNAYLVQELYNSLILRF